jgi:CheY-like chemotaxis protein
MSHTLLLADDSVTIRRVIELTFADEDVRVTSVSSGREALASIEASRPDIVLADAGMADVSGYDIAAFVKGRGDLKHIPVILLAGAFDPLDEARARQAGSSGVLIKPFEPQMAVARVRELLSSGPPAEREEMTAPAPGPPVNTETPAPAAPALSNDAAGEWSLDRLDQTFSSGLSKDFGNWDLPQRPGSVVPAAPDEVPAPIDLKPKAPASPPAVKIAAPLGEPLADAFSSLLAAEEGRHSEILPRVGLSPETGGPLSDEDMDLIVERLITRLGPDVRLAVIDLAERLVRAEIDRLKALR